MATSKKISNCSCHLEVVSSAMNFWVDISGGLLCNSHNDRITSIGNSTIGFIKRNIKTKNEKLGS